MKIKAKGMHCPSCETLIEISVSKIEGVNEVKANYPNETVEIKFDHEKTNVDEIFKAIEEKGYECSLVDEITIKSTQKSRPNKKVAGFVFGLIGILVIGYFISRFAEGIAMPEISQNMGYGLLFIVGILTGFHCISMCGGFVVSYTAKDAQQGKRSYNSHLQYGLGKTISYTIIGAAFGLLGAIITFTPMIRGVAGIIAGLFLVIFGLNMLNVFPILRKIRIKTPKFVSKFVGKKSKDSKSPLLVGMLNGLMIACGPLQAIYIMAAGSGSMIEGAKMLFIFGLGTLPVLLSFGLVASIISNKATHKILKASGVIVIVLGLVMVNQGLALTGTGLDSSSLIASLSTSEDGITGNAITMDNGYQVIKMEVNRRGWNPDKFVLKKGVPVKWIINGNEINGCNNAIQVPKLGLKFDIKHGEQTIEFTPKEEGIIPWSCWMGMIRGDFIVKDDIDLSDTAQVKKELDAVPKHAVGSCGGSCGNPTCGGGTRRGCGCGG